ncbi:hypothetical protein SNEBB_001441 [Seison nebaliae]|nr:hypothetical protein SNEBB_001441 [Seison nebaliae]
MHPFLFILLIFNPTPTLHLTTDHNSRVSGFDERKENFTHFHSQANWSEYETTLSNYSWERNESLLNRTFYNPMTKADIELERRRSIAVIIVLSIVALSGVSFVAMALFIRSAAYTRVQNMRLLQPLHQRSPANDENVNNPGGNCNNPNTNTMGDCTTGKGGAYARSNNDRTPQPTATWLLSGEAMHGGDVDMNDYDC